MTKREQHFMKLACQIAERSTFRDYKLGAIVVYKGKILSSGANLAKTHPLQRKFDHHRLDERFIPVSTHAEVNAIQKIIKDNDIDWSKCTIYVARVLKNGKTAMSRPCNSCMQLMKSLGVKNVYYTTDFGVAHEYITQESTGKVCVEKAKA